MTPQKILSEVRCQIQYQYRIKLEMSNSLSVMNISIHIINAYHRYISLYLDAFREHILENFCCINTNIGTDLCNGGPVQNGYPVVP